PTISDQFSSIAARDGADWLGARHSSCAPNFVHLLPDWRSTPRIDVSLDAFTGPAGVPGLSPPSPLRSGSLMCPLAHPPQFVDPIAPNRVQQTILVTAHTLLEEVRQWPIVFLLHWT